MTYFVLITHPGFEGWRRFTLELAVEAVPAPRRCFTVYKKSLLTVYRNRNRRFIERGCSSTFPENQSLQPFNDIVGILFKRA